MESKTAEQFLGETVSDYNEKTSHVYQFQFTNQETELFTKMLDEFANQEVQRVLSELKDEIEKDVPQDVFDSITQAKAYIYDKVLDLIEYSLTKHQK